MSNTKHTAACLIRSYKKATLCKIGSYKKHTTVGLSGLTSGCSAGLLLAPPLGLHMYNGCKLIQIKVCNRAGMKKVHTIINCTLPQSQ